MPQSLIDVGEKLHIITRRIFEGDLRRHFVGTVRAVERDVVRVQGYTFVFNPSVKEYRRRPEVRTRIFGLGDAQMIVNIIPPETDLERTQYVVREGRLVISDGNNFNLDVNEFGATS